MVLIRMLIHREIGPGKQRIDNALRELRLLGLRLGLRRAVSATATKSLSVGLLLLLLVMLEGLRALQILRLGTLAYALGGLGADLCCADVFVEMLVELWRGGAHLRGEWGRGVVHRGAVDCILRTPSG